MADIEKKPACKYGANCYRLNEGHLMQFSHPPKGNEAPANVYPAANVSPAAKRSPNESVSPPKNSDAKKIKRLSPEKQSTSPEPSVSANDELDVKIESDDVRRNDTTAKPPNDIDFISNKFDEELPFSQKNEYRELIASPAMFIKTKFLAQMPDDFYQLWNFCTANGGDNQRPECVFEKFDLELIGPFDVLSGKFDKARRFEPAEYLRHWRFFYDPPEFQSIMKKKSSGVHFGYWRDDRDSECLIAKNDCAKNCEFDFVADNAFSAVIHFLDKELKTSPFNRSAAVAMKKELETFAETNRISLSTFSPKLKSRNLRSVCKTFHRAGLIVPFDRKTDVGYRQLQISDDNLKKIFREFREANGDQTLIDAAMEKLHPLVTAANIGTEFSFLNQIEYHSN